MPELPEVETLRRSLEAGLVGRTIVSVRVLRRDVIVAPGDPHGGFSRQRPAGRPRSPARFDRALLLVADRIDRLDRRGKQLALVGARGGAVGVHLGMTGLLDLADDNRPGPAHTHVLWRLDNGSVLRFADARRFGGLRLLPEGPAALWARLGPDALDIDADALAERLARTDRAIKAALLDQSVLAGVGNIYADEALFAAGIHPARPARSLDGPETERLAGQIRRVLASAIDSGGSTIRDYRDGSGRAGSYQTRHAVYGRGGGPCLRCGTTLEQGLLAQRTTVWCPRCQPVHHAR